MPLYETREAAVYNHYNWDEWVDALTYDERVLAVAQYRMHHTIEAHVNDAHATQMERDNKRRNAAGKGR